MELYDVSSVVDNFLHRGLRYRHVAISWYNDRMGNIEGLDYSKYIIDYDLLIDLKNIKE